MEMFEVRASRPPQGKERARRTLKLVTMADNEQDAARQLESAHPSYVADKVIPRGRDIWVVAR